MECPSGNRRIARLRMLRGCAAACLAFGAMADGAENIRPRGAAAPPPPTPEELEARRLQKAQDMSAWLPRLVGRFEVEGVVSILATTERASGKVDCIAVGTGPGVNCVLYVTWDEVWGDFSTGRDATLTAGVPFLGPASVLYGFDPTANVVRYMQLDTDGLVTDGEARLNGNTLSWRFEGHCPSEPQASCVQEARLYAPPHARYLHMSIETSSLMQSGGGDRANIELEMTPISRSVAGTPAPTPLPTPNP